MDKFELIIKRAVDTGSEVIVSTAHEIITKLKEYKCGDFACYPYSFNSISIEWLTKTKRAGIIIGQNDLNSGWYILTIGELFENQPWGYLDTLDIAFLLKELGIN